MADSQMDKERVREQKRASALRAPFARRQHKLLSSVHLSGCNGKRHNISGLVMGSGEDTADVSPADGWKKEKATRDSGGSSSNEEGGAIGDGCCRSGDGDKEPRTPPIASASSTKKRVKFNGKVSDGFRGVDPAVVPRKLRSAMSKRVNGSLSPSLPKDGRMKDRLAGNGGNLPVTPTVEVSGSLTKDEEDAVETLSALAQMVTDGKLIQVCVDGIRNPETSDSKASTSANVEESTGDLYCSEKLLEEPEGPLSVEKAGVAKEGSPMEYKECHKLELELNLPAELDANELDLMKIVSNVDLNDAANLIVVDPQEPMPKLFLTNEGVRPPKEASSPPKSHSVVELLECPSGTLRPDAKCQEKPELVSRETCREETNLGMRFALPVAAGGQPDVACCSSEPGPSRTSKSAEKAWLLSSDRRRTWKKCATHVYIGYLIQRCQMTERKCHVPMPCKRPKLEVVAVTDEASEIQNSATSLSSMETDRSVDGKLYDMKTGPVHEKGKKSVQLLQKMPRTNIHPKQNCDPLTFLAGSEFPTPGTKDSAKFSSTNLTMVPHQSVVSFSLPSPYSSPYPDQLAVAAQQVQLQIPPQYLTNPFYGFQMGHMGGPAKQHLQRSQQQQQQFWQAHVTQYWMPPVLPKWQNGRPLDPSQSPIPRTQMQPVLQSPPVDAKGVVVSHYRPAPMQHKTLPIPLQTANRSK